MIHEALERNGLGLPLRPLVGPSTAVGTEPPLFQDDPAPTPLSAVVRGATTAVLAANRPLETVTAAQLLAEPEPAYSWLVSELFPASGVGILGGPRKAMKTMLILQAAIAIADPAVRSFLGRPVERHGPVLFVEQEGSRAKFAQRLGTMLAGHEPPAIHFALHQRLRIDVSASWGRLVAAVNAIQPVLIVLDPLVFLHSGDENSNTEMARVMAPLVELAADFDTCVIVLHHLSKPSERKVARPADRIRGAGAFVGATDVNMVLEREGENGLRLQAEYRDADDLDLYLELDTTTLRLVVAQRPEADRKLPRSKVVAWVNSLPSPAGVKDAQEQFRVSRGTAWAALFDAANAGLIDHYQHPRFGNQFMALGVSTMTPDTPLTPDARGSPIDRRVANRSS